MKETFPNLPLAEADRQIRDRIDHHRSEMQAWRRARAARVAAERATGRAPADIAAELGVTTQVVYELLRASSTATRD